MKRAKGARAIVGVVLVVGGLLAALPTPYRERTVVFETHGCRLDTTIIESKTESPKGTVLLLHGLASNKKIMSYTARSFAAMNLRVVVPDLPGHGHTPGPFSPQRAEDCSRALLGDLFVRGMAQPDTTILAGHSMGAAIALRIAAAQPVAGLIAISPAPMNATHGAPPEAILFDGAPKDSANALVLSGQYELESMRANAAELVNPQNANGSRYEIVRGATHVSLIFDAKVMGLSQEWAARVLHLGANGAAGAGLPSRIPLLAGIAGLIGILLIAGPFLSETLGAKGAVAAKAAVDAPGFVGALVIFAAASLAAVGALHWFSPLRRLRVFEGDYFAGFLLVAAIIVLAGYWRYVRSAPLHASAKTLASSIFAGVVLLLLLTGWLEVTFSEAWLGAERWARFPFFLAAVLPFHFAEELLLGAPEKLSGWRRLAAGMSIRFVGWLALLLGIFYVHSGEVLLALLAPYFVLLSLLQRGAMDSVRIGTGSATAAAVFGAIILAGFCLVIFPIT